MQEIRGLVVKYIKEETIQPVKEMGRFIAFGALGSIFVGFGTTRLLIGALRFLQGQVKVPDGSLSWVPCLIVAVLAAAVIALPMWRIVSGTANGRFKDTK